MSEYHGNVTIAAQFYEAIHDCSVELAAACLLENFDRSFHGHSPAVGSRAGHGVEGVDDREQPGHFGDVFAREDIAAEIHKPLHSRRDTE